MANEPTRPIGGTTMNNLVINKETTVKEALAGNGVLMVGKIKNKKQREMEMMSVEVLNSTSKEQALATNNVIMVGRRPNKREVMAKMEANNAIVDISEDKVEIPEFLLRVQEERKLSKIQRVENKKKAPIKKPSFRNAFISILKIL